jgi:hypothetical protein
MRKSLIGLGVFALLIAGCSTGAEAKKKEKERPLMSYRDKQFKNDTGPGYTFNNWVVDTRTGCLISSVAWGKDDSGMTQVLDPEGKPVGCYKAGGMSVEDYFNLPQDK